MLCPILEIYAFWLLLGFLGVLRNKKNSQVKKVAPPFGELSSIISTVGEAFFVIGARKFAQLFNEINQ